MGRRGDRVAPACPWLLAECPRPRPDAGQAALRLASAVVVALLTLHAVALGGTASAAGERHVPGSVPAALTSASVTEADPGAESTTGAPLAATPAGLTDAGESAGHCRQRHGAPPQRHVIEAVPTPCPGSGADRSARSAGAPRTPVARAVRGTAAHRLAVLGISRT
jgi:hypothetical protein